MKIQELIDELSKIRDKDPENPEKDVVIEVFDIKKSMITRGWMFDIVIEHTKEVVKIRQKKFRGWNVYIGSRTKDIEDLEKSLCTSQPQEGGGHITI